MPLSMYRTWIQIGYRLLRRNFEDIIVKNSDFFLKEEKDTL